MAIRISLQTMLTHTTHGDTGPDIFLLHWLGGSAHTWDLAAPTLSAYGYRVTALDLPGFGDSASLTPATVGDSLTLILDTIRSLRASASAAPWLLVGHSMGGKFATLLAHTAATDPALANLAGLVLFSPSPPTPEPMPDSKREQLIATMGNDATGLAAMREDAQHFLDDNTGKLPLSDTASDAALHDLLRMNRAAFRNWFTIGSKEDWLPRLGQLSLPTLVLAGTAEGPLGYDAQQKLAPTYLTAATIQPLQGCGHLSPIERPNEVADRIAAFATSIGVAPHPAPPALYPDFAALIHSDSTSPQTRAVLLARLTPAPPATEILQALARIIIPGASGDIAARLAASLSSPTADGWRFDVLPPDATAWQRGLASLDHAALSTFSVPFSALDAPRAASLIKQAQDGKLTRTLLDTLTPHSELLTAAEMKHWIEDVRSEFAKLYVADPRTMQRIGFTGFADNHGFTQIRLEDQTTDAPEPRA